MKIFRKSHMWKENKTFMELEAEKPKMERGYPVEGHVLLKIGKESSIKGAFKLSADEARGLRDSIDLFLKFHDKKLSNLRTKKSRDYKRKKRGSVFDYGEEEDEEEDDAGSAFFMFNSDEEDEDDEESRFYF